MSNELTAIKTEVTQKAKAFHMRNVNMNYSFSKLEELAIKKGVKFKNGDVLVVDNRDKSKRKMYKKTENGAVIIYAFLTKGEFTHVSKVGERRQPLEYFGTKNIQ